MTNVRPDQRITPADVRQVFHEMTGDHLDVTKRLSLQRFGGGVSEELTMSGGERVYGEFRFVVEVTSSSDPFLNAARRPAEASPDADGIFWHFQPRDELGGGHWFAEKFVDNVKLVWVTASKRTNRRWNALNRVMQRLGELPRQR